MLTITETHHNGRVRTWTADNEEDFVLRVLAAHANSGSLSPDISFDDAVKWLRSDLRRLDIAARPDADFSANRRNTMTTYADLTHIQERLGSEASIDDAQAVANLAAELAEEQGDDAFDLLDWLQNRTYPWTELFEASQGNVAALFRVRAEAHLPPLDIAARHDAEFPTGLTGESAYYAADGPRDQAVSELQRIEAVARAHGTEQSMALADEARTYLAWLADHESCADMPEDWEAE